MGRVVLFLKTKWMVSPTVARTIGPSIPRCWSACDRGFNVVNLLLVYSR
jgi:hypothetical protein